MDAETRQSLGCFAMGLVATWIGFMVRSQHNWGHFWAMMGVEVIILVVGLLAIAGLVSDNNVYRVLGGIAGLYALSCMIAVGMFLYKGNYEASMKFVTWRWRGTTASPTAPATATPVKTPTSEPSPEPSAGPQPDVGPWGWLLAPTISESRFISTLNGVSKQTAEQARSTADSLQRASLLAESVPSQQAIGLLTGVAFERAGDDIHAHQMYQQVVDRNSNDMYAASAQYRLHFVKVPPGKFNLLKSGQWWTQKYQYQNRAKPAQIEMEYVNIIRESETTGWFPVGGQWQRTTSRGAAIQNMLNRRTDQISFEFFQYLRSRSPFPTQYSFLFIILFITLGIKFLALPIYVKQAKLAVLSPKIQRDLQLIQSLYSSDNAQLSIRQNEVYAKYGVEVVSGCIMPIVDLIFVLWAFIAIQGYVPQLALDQARFLWLDNLIEKNLWIMFAWAGIYLVTAYITGELQAYGRANNPNASESDAIAGGCGSLAIMLAVWGSLMWSSNISPALIVFWICLLLISAILTLILQAIWKMVLKFQGIY